ncbi:MAG: hypothetical protein NTZ17_18660 [Phycisphaerae bacterium]|nr:hypothetical protein [Phycisphaerae bacterium]
MENYKEQGGMMERKLIRIDQITIPIALGKPISREGVFSGKTLAGMEVTVRTRTPTERKAVDDLIREARAAVDDPFANRSYEATIRMLSQNITAGRDEASYVLSAEELDQLPPFDSIELNGMEFSVLDYEEYITQGKIDRRALLQASKEQFPRLRGLLGPGPIAFRRLGIDETPLELRFGGDCHWSRHGTGSDEYYKQIVVLCPLDAGPSRLDVASGTTQDVMARILIALAARFEVLVNELATGDAISSQVRNALLSSGWRDLFPSQKIAELYDSLDQVDDAAERFKTD